MSEGRHTQDQITRAKTAKLIRTLERASRLANETGFLTPAKEIDLVRLKVEQVAKIADEIMKELQDIAAQMHD